MAEFDKEQSEYLNLSNANTEELKPSTHNSKYEIVNEVENSGVSYELSFKHVRNESVFWDGQFTLQPTAIFKGTVYSFNLPVEAILKKYVPRDYYLMKDDPDDGVVLINDQFKAINLNEKLGSIFRNSKKRVNVFLRSRDLSKEDFSLTTKGSSISTGKNLYESHVSSTELQNANCVQLNVEEMSGRKILWDAKAKVFQSSVRLVFNRQELPGLKVDEILTNILASGYLENTQDVLERQIWTDKIKVVGNKDAIDVLFLSTNKCNLYLKYITNLVDQQWQEITDTIDMFTQKVVSIDDELRKFYEDNNVFEEMRTLKGKIQSETRNEEEIDRMMKKLEPRLNLALSLINLLDSDGTVTADIKSQSKSVVNNIMKKSGPIKFDLYHTVSQATGIAFEEETKVKEWYKPKFWDW